MPKKANQKLRILYVRQILREYSDESHYLTVQDIIDKLEQLYGVTAERKSVMDDLAALEDYGEALLFVSHDRWFIEKFANRIWCLQDGKIEDFRGSFSENREYKRRQEEIAQATKAKPEKKGDTRQKRPPNREKALKKAEAAVEKAEAAMAELDAQIQQYSADYEKLMELTEKKEQAEQELEALYAAWEALENE